MTTPDKPQFTHDLINICIREAEWAFKSTHHESAGEAIRALKSSIPNARILGPEEVAVPRELIEAVVCRLEVETGNAAIGFARRLRAMLSSSSPQNSGMWPTSCSCGWPTTPCTRTQTDCAVHKYTGREQPSGPSAGEQKATQEKCSRARTDMTPCVLKDGDCAADIRGECVGCGWPKDKIRATPAAPDAEAGQKPTTIDMPPGVRAIPSTLVIPEAEAGNMFTYEWIRIADENDNAICFCYTREKAVRVTDALKAEDAAAALRKGKP